MDEPVEGEGQFQAASASFGGQGLVTIELPLVDQTATAIGPDSIDSFPAELKAAILGATPPHHALTCNLWTRDPTSTDPMFELEFVEQSTGQHLFGPESFRTGAELGAAAASFLEDLAGP